MKDKHITDILDNSSLVNLSEHEMQSIRAHIGSCAACTQAYQAAQLSDLVVKERAAEAIEPPPFFQTRVMAAWREQQASGPVPALWRLWKSAGALVSSLALTTAALAALSFAIPETTTQTPVETAANIESVVLEGTEGEGQMTEEQMLSAMYVDDEGTR